MLFNKKTALSISSFILFSLVTACSSNITPNSVPLTGDTSFANSNLVNRISETVTQSKQDPSHFFIDAGKGQKTGVSISMKLNLGIGGDFKTKASADGTPQKVIADLAKLKVALIEGSETVAPTTLTGALDIGAGANTAVILSPKTGSTPTITFTNVPKNSNTTNKAYWIAASALDSTNADITNKTSGSYDFIGADTNYYSVSDSNGGVDRLFAVGDPFEGEDATAAVGSIQVADDPTANGGIFYVVSSTDTLGLSLKLQDAIGAQVDSSLTVTNGSDRSTTIGVN